MNMIGYNEGLFEDIVILGIIIIITSQLSPVIMRIGLMMLFDNDYRMFPDNWDIMIVIFTIVTPGMGFRLFNNGS